MGKNNFENSVSVIIPNYNNARWLRKCIGSCLIQKPFLKEIIVVDDHSTDDSWTILEGIKNKFNEYVKIYKNPYKGANNARNFGFEKSTGEYIQWLDSDDEILPRKFENQLEAFVNFDCDIVYSDWRMDFYENLIFIRSQSIKCENYQDYLLELIKDNWTSSNNYLIKRATTKQLHTIQAWNPKTLVGQDREYFTFAAIFGTNFKYAPGEFAVYNRWSSMTISGMDFDERLELNQILEKNFRNEIENKFSGRQLNKYLKVLNAHKIKAVFYNRKINFDRNIFPWEIQWKLIHWKMKLFIPYIILRCNIKLLLNSLKKNR